MKLLTDILPGDEVALIRNGSHLGDIVKIDAITPTGLLRIGTEYFKVHSGDYASIRGSDRYYRAYLQPLSTELREQIIRKRMIDYIGSRTNWAKFSDDDLHTVFQICKKYQ